MVRSSDFKFWEGSLPIDEGDSKLPAANFRQETSTLLPQNHQYSCLSPTSRLRAIVDGRRELNEMINNLPESSYELSLKDIVDDQQNTGDEEPEEEVVLAEEKKVKHKRQDTKNTKTKQICRTESMESKVFQLKMFLPVSLGSKKGKAKKCSKVCPGQSSEKSANKDWWKTMYLAVKHNPKNTIINRSTSDISSNRTSEKKDKSRAQRGCLF
ncbi:hypothetical protein ACS0TY_029707 [Phlomoides rotata]